MTPAQEVQLLFQHVTRQQVQDAAMPAQDSAPVDTAQSSDGKEERPSKWSKENSKGGYKRGKGNTGEGDKSEPAERSERQSSQRQNRQSWRKWEDRGQSSQNWNREMDQLRESMQLLARVAIRREDELSQARLEKEYVLTTVTFLLTLGFRDPFMNRMHTLLGLMCGLGATKVAAFRMRPAKAERQPLVRVLEERFQPPSRNALSKAEESS